VYAPRALDSLPVCIPPALPPTDGPLAVALSHSHLDHSHLAGFVDPAIPIYASEPAARIVELLGRTGRAIGGVPTSLVSPADGCFSVGAMRARLLPVDHDVGGACGLLIETADGVIAYSGDLRLHGRHPERTLGFARAAREAGARLLILEGTRLGQAPVLDPEVAPPAYRFEADVALAVSAALETVSGRLGVILLTPENGERVEAIAAAVAGQGRTLVLEPEGLAFAEAALGRPLEAPYAVYRAETQDRRPSTVGTADIAAFPGRYLLQLDFTHFAGLLDIIGPGGGGVILACNGPPLGRYEPAWGSLEWWAATLGCPILEVGSSGHAAGPDLALIAGHSGVTCVMSIHSRQPELLAVPPERLLLPEPGRTYDLNQLQ
jgi:ribonuclease J